MKHAKTILGMGQWLCTASQRVAVQQSPARVKADLGLGFRMTSCERRSDVIRCADPSDNAAPIATAQEHHRRRPISSYVRP
jgi:hypothetical protein